MADARPETTAANLSAPTLGLGLRLNLSVMMFLQFAVWGAWFVVLGNYVRAMNFSDVYVGSLYATIPLGAIISPIFVGQIADRYFSSERLMAILHLVGAGLLFWLAQLTEPRIFYWVALLYALMYAPTLALCNSISFTHLPDATRDFPGVRVLGTIGWIVAGFAVTALLYLFANADTVKQLPAPEFSVLIGGVRFTLPLLLAAMLSLLLGLWSFFLPHTPPTGKAGETLPFLRAVGLMREPSFAVFYGVSFVITIVLAFYYSFTGLFLQNSQGVEEAAISSIMTIGQFAEMILLPFLPFFLYRMGMKWVLALGMLCWGIRYGIFALGSPYALILLGIALHGICFDFFFAAGFIHVDNKAPRDIRASAQALFGFLTYGAGMYLGSELSGRVAAYFTDPATDTTNWTGFWLVPCIGVLISFAIFVLFFRDDAKEASTEAVAQVEPQTA
ncbi:MAG: MFS transporter [Gemmataceae bacterium]